MLCRGGGVAGALHRLVDNEGGYCSSDFDEDGDDEDVRRTPDKRQQSATPRMRISPPTCDVAAVPFTDLGEPAGDDAAPIESGEEFHGLDIFDDESSTGEDVGGASVEGSGGCSNRDMS
jgi:hypothetical protein